MGSGAESCKQDRKAKLENNVTCTLYKCDNPDFTLKKKFTTKSK